MIDKGQEALTTHICYVDYFFSIIGWQEISE